MLIDDLAKVLDNQCQVDTFILDFEKASDTSQHELLKSKLFSYGQLNGLMLSFATDNKELWLTGLNLTGPLLYLVSLRAHTFLVPCCSHCI